ncbi:MAG: DinB family protein [Phycisphaerales bacterium]|nr:MAG: DinB family protein [Phycisphaerales bacterium]
MLEVATTPTPVHENRGDAEDAASLNPFALLAASLRQLAEVLVAATDEQYVRQPVGVIPGSLGGHVRHCLDHFAALCAGATSGLIDYDRRQRGTAIETSRSAALHAIRGLQDRLAPLDASMMTRGVRVVSMLTVEGTSIEVPSSLGRELAFVLSHTVHHNALVSAMCSTLGIPVPERFGFAPSTIAHLDRSACVPSPSSR